MDAFKETLSTLSPIEQLSCPSVWWQAFHPAFKYGCLEQLLTLLPSDMVGSHDVQTSLFKQNWPFSEDGENRAFGKWWHKPAKTWMGLCGRKGKNTTFCGIIRSLWTLILNTNIDNQTIQVLTLYRLRFCPMSILTWWFDQQRTQVIICLVSRKHLCPEIKSLISAHWVVREQKTEV